MAKIKRRKQTIENDPQEIQILELSDRLQNNYDQDIQKFNCQDREF